MKVFISFAQKDHHLVLLLSSVLLENGLTPLVATQRLTPGVRLDDKVHQMINESDCVIALNTPNAAESIWVQQEIGTARALGKYIVPLKSRRVRLTAMLEGYEYYEFKTSDPKGDFNHIATFLINYAAQHDIDFASIDTSDEALSKFSQILHLPNALVCPQCKIVNNHVWICLLCGDWLCVECGELVPPESRAG